MPHVVPCLQRYFIGAVVSADDIYQATVGMPQVVPCLQWYFIGAIVGIQTTSPTASNPGTVAGLAEGH